MSHKDGSPTARRPVRQDTFDLRGDDPGQHTAGSDHGDHSVLEDDSGDEQQEEFEDDNSSSLSIPNESIDFDLVYSLHSFAATVEGQANVVKGDSLVLMDDSNSYWWLVRVLKTQEVGYIPAENIETPFERLARLNKHRNVDLASATQEERDEDPRVQHRIRTVINPRNRNSPSTTRTVIFSGSSIHNYPPAVWNEDEDYEDDEDYDDGSFDDGMGDEEQDDMEQDGPGGEQELEGGWDADTTMVEQQQLQQQQQQTVGHAPSQQQHQQQVIQQQIQSQQQQQILLQQQQQLQQQQLQQQQHQQQQQQQLQLQLQRQPQQAAEPVAPQQRSVDQQQYREQQAQLGLGAAPGVRQQSSRERVAEPPSRSVSDASVASQASATIRTSPGPLLPSAMLQQTQENAKRAREEAAEAEASARRARAAPDRRLLRKERDTTDDERDPKQKKKGVFSGIFGRKDKDKKKRPGSGDPESIAGLRSSEDDGASPPARYRTPTPSAPPVAAPAAHHTLKIDQQQQQAYQAQYLTRSPASPGEVVLPSYGLQSAAVVMGLRPDAPPSSRQRPGSLILSPTAPDGHSAPDLSVMRVFAGTHVQSEATFKTVLLNGSTTAADLVRQAIQRFRLGSAEDAADYFLTVKRVEGSSATLRPHEHPLRVFEALVEAAHTMPRVKRSSVGSISSVVSNLSQHPAITKLGMNDFADDSAVKFYLNRRAPPDSGGAASEDDDDMTVRAGDVSPPPGNVQPERFSSPSTRFALQLVIFPEDLPDGMVFDPHTEAIVPRAALRDRAGASASVSTTQRRKVFALARNATVAEVIELGLERFGIVEGVVDGGDEVEDKLAKRRSAARVRYALMVSGEGGERELQPSTRVLDAFVRAPAFRAVDRGQRRSADLAAAQEDIAPDDPVFVLRRAVGYRPSGGRSRLSASLDEVALQHLHRQSASSDASTGVAEDTTKKPMSRQELIAAQREASRATQRALLSAQANSERGVDIVLPDRARLRSSRAGAAAAVRYSYIAPDGAAHDVSDLLQAEWRDASARDVLDGPVGVGREGIINRVIEKIRDNRLVPAQPPTPGSAALSQASMYSASDDLDTVVDEPPAKSSRATTPSTVRPTPGPTTPARRQPSDASDRSSYEGTPGTAPSTPATTTTPAPRRALVLRDPDFGVQHMLAVIELSARRPPRRAEAHDPLFGARIDLDELHPKVRDVYESTFRSLDEMDLKLDQLLQLSTGVY